MHGRQRSTVEVTLYPDGVQLIELSEHDGPIGEFHALIASVTALSGRIRGVTVEGVSVRVETESPTGETPQDEYDDMLAIRVAHCLARHQRLLEDPMLRIRKHVDGDDDDQPRRPGSRLVDTARLGAVPSEGWPLTVHHL